MLSSRIGQLASASALATTLTLSSQAAAGELCERTSSRVNSVFTSQYLDQYGYKAYDVGYRMPLGGGCAPRYGLELSTSLPQDNRRRVHDLIDDASAQTTSHPAPDALSSSIGGYYAKDREVYGLGLGRGGLRAGFTEHTGRTETAFELHANPVNKSAGFSFHIKY